MPILRLQHQVKDYAAWKSLFDADPIDRKGAGVIGYQIAQAVEDPNFVMIDVEVAAVADAEKLMKTIRAMWEGAGKDLLKNPQAHLITIVETISL